MTDKTESVKRRDPLQQVSGISLGGFGSRNQKQSIGVTGYEEESDLMETSALDGTSENNDHESYDLDSDSDSPINRSQSRRARNNQNVNNNDYDNNNNNHNNNTHNDNSDPKHDASSERLGDNNCNLLVRPMGNDSNKIPELSKLASGGGLAGGSAKTVITTTTIAHAVLGNSPSGVGKVSGTKLISRRERSYRRHRNNNFIKLAEYDHDGDIDKSDDDDDDDDDYDDKYEVDNDRDSDNDYDDSSIDNNNNGDLVAGESSYGKDIARFRSTNTAISNCTIKRRRQDKQQVFLRSRMQAADRGVGGAVADVENTSYGSEEDNNHHHHHHHHEQPSHLGQQDLNHKCRGHKQPNSEPNYYYNHSKYNIDPSQNSKISARCSEYRQSPAFSSSWSPSIILSGIRSIFNRLINNEENEDNNNDVDDDDDLASKTSPKQQQQYQSGVFELKKCNQLPAKYRKASFDTSKSSSIEWQRSLSVGSQADITMPNNYGSNTRYQQFYGPDEPSRGSTGASGSRRASGSGHHQRHKSRETFSSSTRRWSASQNGYAKLGYYHHQKSTKQSVLQELKRIVLLLIIIGVCAVVLWQIYLVLDAENNYLGVVNSNSKLGQYTSYAVATDAQPCSSVGKSLLAKGGHAVDAAIGTLLCMGVALPNSLGLGGGCLITIYDKQTKTAVTIDGREIAPDYASEHMFANNSLAASRGPLSVGVPGELAAYWEAHKLYGKLAWSDLFEDSIRMAEKGSPMVEHLAFAFRDWTHAQYVTQPLRDIFWNTQTNDYFKEGDIVRQPALAETLKRIRDNGVGEFYNGTTGQLFVEDLAKQGGKITMDNLRKYRALVKPALSVKIDDDLQLYTQSMPASGVVLGLIMRVMKELGYFKNQGAHDTFQAASLFYHHLAESFKFAYAQRAGLEDSLNADGQEDPRMAALMKQLLSDEFVKEIAAKIDNKTHSSQYYGGSQYFQEDHGTAHTSVMDSMGNSVAVTTSVNLYFGSGLVSPSTGIIYNDVMDDFVSPGVSNKFMLPPSKYNRIRPGKRPLSSMAPSVFVDGQANPILIVGASGGAKITTAVATVALRNIYLGENVKAAIDAPRIHHQYLPDNVWYESNFPQELLESLKLRGHQLKQITGRSSVVMAVACNYLYENDDDHNDGGGGDSVHQPSGKTNSTRARWASRKILTANSDYRKGGSVDGL